MRTSFLAVLALLCFTFVAAAADVSGKWTAEQPGRGGGAPTTITYTFKVSGATLTGTVSNPQGETPIADGKVDGDTITFSMTTNFGGTERKNTYTGKVKGDTIEMTREGGRGPQTSTLKKAM